MQATDYLHQAAQIMEERGKQYDQPQGERSMGKIVAAFNIVTGKELSEAEGWAFMMMLKQVRFFQRPDKPHRDSVEDLVAYSALFAESAMSSPDPRTMTDLAMPDVVIVKAK